MLLAQAIPPGFTKVDEVVDFSVWRSVNYLCSLGVVIALILLAILIVLILIWRRLRIREALSVGRGFQVDEPEPIRSH